MKLYRQHNTKPHSSCHTLPTAPSSLFSPAHVSGLRHSHGPGENRRNFLASCSFSGVNRPCEAFKPMLTDQGVCHSFNAEDWERLYKETEYTHVIRGALRGGGDNDTEEQRWDLSFQL